MTSANRRGYIVDKRTLEPDVLRTLRKDLTVRADWNPETSYGPPPPSFKVFLETADKLAIPQYFGQQLFGPPAVGFPAQPVRQGLEFVGRLKSETRQPEAVAAAMQAFREHGGGILSLPTGAHCFHHAYTIPYTFHSGTQ